MNKYSVLFAVIIYFFVSGETFTQNFFPIGIDDELQELSYYYHYSSMGGSYTELSYPAFNISDSVIYQQKVYYKYKNKYLAYDSTAQKLFIYLSGNSYLAADFNLPTGSTQVLYYSGIPRVWKSNGITYEIILGFIRKIFTMSSDTNYFHEPSGYFNENWMVKIVEDIGPYYDYYYMSRIGMDETESITSKHTIIFARIDTAEFNFYNQGIQLVEPVRDRYISEFPYILPLDVTNPITGLISEFSSEFNIFRNDNLISSRTFNIDTSTFLGFINIQPEELREGDKIQFKCILEDFSIFNNIRVTPDSGYYTFYVLPDTANQVKNEINKVSHFSLSQNFPNPFNPTTNIQYSTGMRQFVTLKVYDVLGNEVSTLVNEEKPAGSYLVEFYGSNLASGIYFYQLKAGNFTATKKLILLK